MARSVTVSRREERDLRRVQTNDRKAVVDGLRALAREDANPDVKALAGHPGWAGHPRWYRLRDGNWRVLYYSDPHGIVVERIVDRRDLERTAIDTAL